jgi:hypothetical protein
MSSSLPAHNSSPGGGASCFDAVDEMSRLLVVLFMVVPVAALGEGDGFPGSTPLAVDFKRAPVGSWAEYAVKIGTAGDLKMNTRWALLDRGAGGNTLELTMAGPAAATSSMGGKVVTRMVLVPDPIGASKPFRQIVMQVGEREPMEIPLDMPGLPAQKFQNPDPKKLVGKQLIVVAGGAFQTNHYRDVLPDSTVDSWLTNQVPPLGVVKIQSTPRPDALGPGGQPMPPVSMELLSHGNGARPVITRPARPFDPGAAEKR